MLFSSDAWPGLADGSITLTFRTWKRPQAKVDGQYRVAGMLLRATDVRQVAVADIDESDAIAAGAPSLAALLDRLGSPTHDTLVWRVQFHLAGADDRIDRRADDALAPDDIAALVSRLDRLDARAPGGAWTRRTLHLIDTYPGVVSTALARHAHQDRPTFKVNVRKLKEMGLTESLDIGYRLSPRGAALWRAIG